jgi:aldehyde dehydrogenase (NAD+)
MARPIAALLGALPGFPGAELPGAVINGKPAGSGGTALPVEDPATLEILAHVREATADDVDRAVASAAGAYTSTWRDMAGRDRGRILAGIAAALRDAAPALAELESLDTGKPLRQARSDVDTAARYFEFYSGAADKIYGQTIPGEGDYWSYTLREPYGVVAHVTPWNSPISQMSRGVAPCLAAGNTVVVKPSEVAPLSSLVAGQLFAAAGLPPGACNIVVGRGPTTGNAVITHPGVAHVTFTGSVATGRTILHAAADRILGCNLELGGKSPTIVLPDADLAAAVRAGAMAVVRNAGQSCFATTRLIVHSSIAAEYSERLAAAVSRLTVGPGLEDRDLGPLASAAQHAKVSGMLSDAVADGADLLVGGGRPEGLRGHFLMPAVLAHVTNDMRIARQEVFGPVQSVLVFDDPDEAVALANDSAYGLAAGLFTRDLAAAHRIARRLDAGQVQVNAYPLGGIETPFGGYKHSGLGREKGLSALESYTQLKTVIVSN